MPLAHRLPELGHVRNVLLIIAITVLMAVATLAIAYVFDMIPRKLVVANHLWSSLGSQVPLRADNYL